jgi:hypothetical protein
LVKEFGLVGFDDQEVIGPFVLDQVGGGGFVGVQGVGADQRAAQVQVLEQVLEGGDFVGFGRDADLTAEQLGVGVQGAEELEGLAVDLGGGAGAFAVHRQGSDAQVLEVGTHPLGDDPIQLRGVQALQDPPDGGFTGGDVFTGVAIATGA